MKILYDLSATQPSESEGLFHGGGEYAKVVFFRLCELLPPGTSLDVFFDPGQYTERHIIENCEARGITINHCFSHPDINALLQSKNYDVFYSALPYSYRALVIPDETKFIYTIHGLRTLEYSMDKYALKYGKASLSKILKYIYFLPFFAKYRLKRGTGNLTKLLSVTKNQTIITISNHSKYAISYFSRNVDLSRIKVLYSPLKEFNYDESKDAETLKSFSLEQQKYILLVCGHRNEKGAYRACRVLHKLISNSRIPDDIKVVVLGVSYDRYYLKLTGNNKRFKFHGYVPTEVLESLYKNAHLFLYPTLNEGFGYPPLEAMKYGTICACSANSAITEIYGDSVIYFNPHDDTEMSIRILQSFDEDIRNEKIKKLSARYQQIIEKQKQDLDILVKTIISGS